MKPYLADADFTLYQGDALKVLEQLPSESVHCVVTSPPYWGLRDYGTGTWEGGDVGCDHQRLSEEQLLASKASSGLNLARDHSQAQSTVGNSHANTYRDVCGKCGARRVDQQLGLEPTPDQYVTNMVTLFREVRRVLRRDGTCWLNLGDSYNSPPSGRTRDDYTTTPLNPDEAVRKYEAGHGFRKDRALKPKDLCGIPWRVAFALQQPYYAGRIPDERQREWLAAIIDGEGSIALNYLKPTETNDRNHDYFGPYLRVHNTCEAIVRRCAEITGVGSVKVHDSRRRPVYVWAVYGATAREILREVYPHLIAKQHEARLAYASPGSEDCYAGLKLLHKGSETIVDRPAPPSCLEPGWYLRSDIIWAKPNPMPESVTDRPTKAHEYLFLLTRSPRYFYDADAIREAAEWARWGDQTNGKHEGSESAASWIGDKPKAELQKKRGGGFSRKYAEQQPAHGAMRLDRPADNGGRNARSVWEIATQPYPEAHFATFPEELARRCIAAGTSEHGCCPECGAPWEREVARGESDYARIKRETGNDWRDMRAVAESEGKGHDSNRAHIGGTRNAEGKQFSYRRAARTDLGWQPTCTCRTDALSELLDDGVDEAIGSSLPDVRTSVDGGLDTVVPCTVLDPFMGSGTVAHVARKLGRRSIGIELNPDYCELAARRLAQLSLLAEEAV